MRTPNIVRLSRTQLNIVFKDLGERVLVRSGVERFARRRRTNRTLVLAYHNILPEGHPCSGDSSLHLAQREFARQLDTIAETHEVVPIGGLLNGSQLSPRPRIVITFDDAYEGALTAGLAELARRGMPATILVAPALISSKTWWDTLAEPARGMIPSKLRRHALETLAGDSKAIFDWWTSSLPASGSGLGLPRIATELQLARGASMPGITVGSHSWSHLNLCALNESELEAELVRPLQWLRSRFATVAPWLSYPYGLFSQRVQRAASDAGYVGAFRIDGGWIPLAAETPYAIPRLNIPSGLSINGFRLRLAGL